MEISKEIHDQENLNYSSTGSSSFHLNSFLGLLTSDDDDEDEVQDAYIEIALESSQLPWPPPQPQDQEDRRLNDQEEESQLRISFSRRVFPFPGALRSNPVSVSSTIGSSSSCHDDQSIGSQHSFIQGTPIIIRFRAAVNRLLSLFPSTFINISSPPVCSCELVGRRPREVNMTGSGGRSGVGKFLVKLRVTTFRMMMASLLKLREFTSSPPEKMSRQDIHQVKPRNKQMLVVKPFKKLFGRVQYTQRWKGSGKTGGNTQRSSSAIGGVIINLKGSEEAGRPDGDGGEKAIISSKGQEKKTKSCPASVKSSPTKVHFSCEIGGGPTSTHSQTKMHCGRDNSVQAAIAHCKKSVGRADEFDF